MVGLQLPSLSCTALNEVLRNATFEQDRIKKLLDNQADALFGAISLMQSSEAGKTKSTQGSGKVVYRAGISSTISHPSPTKAEASHAEFLQKAMNISYAEAALLLRDYLEEIYELNTPEVLKETSDFTEIAPVGLLEEHWLREKRFAYSCLVIICMGASSSSVHTYYPIFSDFMVKHSEVMKDIIMKEIKSCLSVSSTNLSALTPLSKSDLQAWTTELLFAYCHYQPMTPNERITLLNALTTSVKNGVVYTHKAMQGMFHISTGFATVESAILFAASLNLSNGLSVVTHSDSEAMDLDAEERENTSIAASLADDTQSLRLINNAMNAFRDLRTTEAAISTLSWASFLRLRTWFADMTVIGTPNNRDFNEESHLSIALESNVFDIMKLVGNERLNIDEILRGDLYHTIWADYSAFLTAFPPKSCSVSQVEEATVLATNLLAQLNQESMIVIAENFWEQERSAEQTMGPHTLLKLSSAIFPQSFRPLVSLLTAFTVSQNSAMRATDYFKNRLVTLSEVCKEYQSSLLVIDYEGNESTYQSLFRDGNPRLERILRTITSMSLDDEDIVYVQAGKDLVDNSYRPNISRGTLGVANTSLTSVTWIVAWDGFGALDHILRVLLSTLKEHDSISPYPDDILGELLHSATESLNFIDRICRSGSKNLRERIAQNEHRVVTISGIVSELADPGDWIRGSWLTKKRRESLLTVSSSCLASIATGSSARARYILDHVCASKHSLPLHAALSAMGPKSFPTVAAFSRIAGLCVERGGFSQDLLRKLTKYTHQGAISIPLHLSDEGHGGADRIYNFLRGVALPLWLTTSTVIEMDMDTTSLHWLLPACSLHLFSKRPSDVLHDPSISSVLATVIRSSAGPSLKSSSFANVRDTFLFPALRAALLTCHEALRSRNSAFQDGLTNTKSGKGDTNTGSSNELTALEKALIKPDIIYALSIMSSGESEGLKRHKFFSSWEQSSFRSFLPEDDQDIYLFLNGSKLDHIAESVSSWKSWVEDMCARCLALQLCCLSQVPDSSKVIQVPWPSLKRSSFSYWRSGGQVIREGYAKRIKEGQSIAALELMVTIVSSGQRAAARSLLGPLPSSSTGSNADQQPQDTREKGAKEPGTEKETASVKKETTTNDSSENRENEHIEILASLVHVLRESRDAWVANLSTLNNASGKKAMQALKYLGQHALFLATGVRFLRICRETHSTELLRRNWEKLKVWELLASLLRCEGAGSRAVGDIDLFKNIRTVYTSALSSFSNAMKDKFSALGIEGVVRHQSLLIDVVSAWKAVVADCFHIFSDIISSKSREFLILRTRDGADRNDGKLPLELFKSEPFSQFAAVFTERWLHILFIEDEHYLTAWSSTESERHDFEDLDLSTTAFPSRGELSVEEHTKRLSASLGNALGFRFAQNVKSQILEEFRRGGDIRTRFGPDFYFDVPAIISFLGCLDVSPNECKDLLLDIMHLNTVLNRMEVQVALMASLSSLASKVIFTDAQAPNQNVALTYSSPQFRGKLCRFLSRVLVFAMPSFVTSSHNFSICAELSKLMGFLSANLSVDELGQPALTAIRFPDPPRHLEPYCTLTPLGQVCSAIEGILASVKQAKSSEGRDEHASLEIVQWLLLSGARFTDGVSFSSNRDVASLGTSAIRSLKSGVLSPAVCKAASVAITSVIDHTSSASHQAFDDECVNVIFNTVANLTQQSVNNPDNGSPAEAASHLICAVARICLKDISDRGRRLSHILRFLSGGGVMGLIPPVGTAISTYTENFESRSPVHLVWCAMLQLSAIAIPNNPSEARDMDELGREHRDVLEFVAVNLERIIEDSLNLSGDWPPASRLEGAQSSKEIPIIPTHLTIGRVEEAEVACITLFKLSNYATHIRETFPEQFEHALQKLIRFSYHVHRLTRAAPVERWVRPVTQQERERSQLLSSEADVTGAAPSVNSTPWNMSPSKPSGSSANATPPRRSPSQVLKAAIGGSTGTMSPSPSLFSPVVGTAGTPHVSSPLVGATAHYASAYLSPSTPWGPHASGLITNSGVHFGEEVTRSLLRALGHALATLRRLAEVMDTLVFSTSMVVAEDNSGLGTLIAYQYHACNDICRGADGDRREALQIIVDNSIHLTITHVMTFSEQGLLSQGMRDEIRKRVGTVRARLLKVLPPVPAHSVVHSPELQGFLHYLKSKV